MVQVLTYWYCYSSSSPNLLLKAYELWYKEVSEMGFKECQPKTCKACQVTLHNLDPDKEYDFKVREEQ